LCGWLAQEIFFNSLLHRAVPGMLRECRLCPICYAEYGK
jgi:hypothetical protein